MTSLLKAKLDEVPEGKKLAYKDLFIKSLIHKALVEKDMQSYKLIMNYVDGLPKQEIKVEGDMKVIGFNFIKPNDTDNTDNKTDNKTE